MRKSSLGFLVVSKELVRLRLTEPSAERRQKKAPTSRSQSGQKKSPDQPKPIGVKTAG